MDTHEQTINALNSLLQKNIDAARGYRKAAKVVEHTSLKAYLLQRANQRQRFYEDLKSEIKSLGGQPKPEPTVRGKLHHAWIDIKAAMTYKTDEAVFEECVRGEKYSLEEYEEKLYEFQLPPSSRSMLIAQRNQVKKDLDNAKSLEELTHY